MHYVRWSIRVVHHYPRMYIVLEDIKKTYDVTLHPITLDGWNLKYVPSSQYDDKIYETAIKSQLLAIKYKKNNLIFVGLWIFLILLLFTL